MEDILEVACIIAILNSNLYTILSARKYIGFDI